MVKVDKLQKAYGNKIVLNNLCLSIPEGVVYGLVGKNGAGKTTLLNILAGISEATSGECMVFGEKVSKGQYSSSVLSYLPDLPNFYDYLTVQEYISFILSGQNKKMGSLPKDLETKYLELGLSGNTRIKALSRGNKQKLGIFVAVITKPKLLILDEPTSALDPVGRRDVMSLIRDLRNQGITILFSTHILSDLELVCDKIGFLHNGAIQKEVDMNANADGDEAVEIAFSTADETVGLSEFASLLPGYTIDQTPERNRIICKPCNGSIDQKEFLSAISASDMSISSIKKTTKKNLEAIMMEVLSE